MRFLQLHSQSADLASFGLNPGAVAWALRGPAAAPPATAAPPRLMRGVPADVRTFIAREFHGAAVSLDGLRAGVMRCPDPWTGAALPTLGVFTTHSRGGMPAELLPLFYAFASPAGGEVWLCLWGTYGKPAMMFLPRLDLVIHDFLTHDAQSTPAAPLLEALRGSLGAFRALLAEPNRPERTERIGLLDMPDNYGHQMLENLSGVQRLADEGLLPALEELWVTGPEFFGPVEEIFPELAGRVRRFPNRWDLFEPLLRVRHRRLFRVGSNVFQQKLRARILATCPVAGRAAERSARPLLAVTVRSSGRQCLNLAEAVGSLHRALSARIPNLGIVLDGWVFPESELVLRSSVATALSDAHRGRIAAEMEEAAAIARALPPHTVVDTLIGLSMRESIGALRSVRGYLAHVGTLQHKLAHFSGAGGLVHAPVEQLGRIESGPYQSEVGQVPRYLPPAAVTDAAVDTPRGARFNNYRITDFGALAGMMAEVLEDS
jgi:hypothetical protein